MSEKARVFLLSPARAFLAFLRDQSGHYTGYALLIWAVTLISIAVGIRFRDEIRAVLAWVIRGLLGGTP
jgi:uncharacterized membrane protein